MPVFAYVLSESELPAIHAFSTSRGWSIDRVFQDAIRGGKPWRLRPAGGELASELGRGDHVLMASEAPFDGARDLAQTLADFRAGGITLHLARLVGLNGKTWSFSSDAAGAELVEKFFAAAAEMYARDRRERIAHGMAKKAYSGKRHCGHPRYGWRWHGDSRVLDLDECKIADRIRHERDAGCSWNQIAVGLLRDRITTKDGKEWSVARVRRVYLASRSWKRIDPSKPCQSERTSSAAAEL